MRRPTVHRNGTSRELLVAQYTEAAHRVDQAVKALTEAAPNARDYYVQGPDAYPQAAREHAALLAHLLVVYDELEALVNDLYDAKERP